MEYKLEIACTAVALLIALIGFYRKPARQGLPLPPGPKPKPIIGNVLDMPQEYQWRTFDKWIKQYGDVCYVEALGNKFVILGSSKATSDIFEKKGAIHSDRLLLPMLTLMGWGGWNLTVQSYGPRWKAHRRTFEDHFRASSVTRYQGAQLQQTRAMLKRLLENPEGFFDHIRFCVSAIIMSVTYGIDIKEHGDPYLEIIEEALDSLARAGAPGSFIVDLVPWLKYVPGWVPGAGFQNKAARWRRCLMEMVENPWKAVKDGMSDGTAKPSVASVLLGELPEGPEKADKEEIAKNVAGVAIVGGADTTASTAQTFFLAMAMYPEAQKKAQAELDTVLGGSRLPDYGDIESLPYVNAVVKECLRWQPVLNVGVAHYSMEDDIYNGYLIPKQSIILGNTWTILHDPVMYPEPEEFNPDRWLKDGKPNPAVKDPIAAFGYGRRICPGQFIANRSLFAMICSILSVFEITAPVDESGNLVKLKPEMTPEFLSYPKPFKCNIKPRSEAAKSLILDSVEAA